MGGAGGELELLEGGGGELGVGGLAGDWFLRERGERGGTDGCVVETVCCEGGARGFAAVVAMAELGVYGVVGEFICDFSTEAGAGDDGRIGGCHCVEISFELCGLACGS